MTHTFHRFMAALVLAASLVTTSSLAQQPAATAGVNRLVVQVSDGDAARWNMALNNTKIWSTKRTIYLVSICR